jgi:hypothetical protein
VSNLKIVLSMPGNHVRLLATAADGDVLKARLPLPVGHPRAAVTLLEGLALWAGSPVCAVISAGRTSRPRCAAEVFGPAEWPAESSLVTWAIADGGRQIRLPGMGDFRDLYAARVLA